MYSFSKSSKIEVLNSSIDYINCGIPFLFGIFVSSSSYDEKNNTEITTDIESLAEFLLKTSKNIIKNYKKIQEKYQKKQENISFFEKINIENTLNEHI
jgi:hypothetical protein